MDRPAPDRYAAAYAAWRADPEAWWAEAADALDWTRRPSRVFDPARGVFGHWFADGELNVCYNCLDRHVDAGNGGITRQGGVRTVYWAERRLALAVTGRTSDAMLMAVARRVHDAVGAAGPK